MLGISRTKAKTAAHAPPALSNRAYCAMRCAEPPHAAMCCRHTHTCARARARVFAPRVLERRGRREPVGRAAHRGECGRENARARAQTGHPDDPREHNGGPTDPTRHFHTRHRTQHEQGSKPHREQPMGSPNVGLRMGNRKQRRAANSSSRRERLDGPQARAASVHQFARDGRSSRGTEHLDLCLWEYGSAPPGPGTGGAPLVPVRFRRHPLSRTLSNIVATLPPSRCGAFCGAAASAMFATSSTSERASAPLARAPARSLPARSPRPLALGFAVAVAAVVAPKCLLAALRAAIERERDRERSVA